MASRMPLIPVTEVMAAAEAALAMTPAAVAEAAAATVADSAAGVAEATTPLMEMLAAVALADGVEIAQVEGTAVAAWTHTATGMVASLTAEAVGAPATTVEAAAEVALEPVSCSAPETMAPAAMVVANA